MRKVLSLLLCVAILCSMVVVVAHADSDPQVQVANVVAVPGSTVVVDLNVVDNALAAIGLTITDVDGLGATLVVTDNGADTLGLTCKEEYPDGETAYPFWSGAVNNTNLTIGTLSITIPADAELGDYEYTVEGTDGCNEDLQAVEIGDTSFTITVTDKVITGVNVAIDAGLAIGVHVLAADIEGVSITAVDVDGLEFKTVEDYEEDEESGDYVFYLNVNPWAMDIDFKVDFTDAFSIDGDALDVDAIPATAKDIGILSYCEALLAGETSDELTQLIADLLAYGQAAQTYQGVAVMDLTELALEPTEAAWEDGDGNPTDFGGYCSENFPADLTGKNATAKKKFEFDKATINFGSKFVVVFTIKNGATATASTAARIKVDGDTFELDGWDFTYAFAPTQYAGMQFDLYASSNTNNTNWAWINNYGPATYAAYLNDNGEEGSAEILDLLEAFYNYGVSAEAYVGSLSE